jgi:hypothetical protein
MHWVWATVLEGKKKSNPLSYQKHHSFFFAFKVSRKGRMLISSFGNVILYDSVHDLAK